MSNLTPNAQTATTYLQQLGWSKAQAAGLVGNFQQESGVNLNTSALGDSGRSFGIAQWSPTRQSEFSKVYGFPIQKASLNQQLNYVDYELTKGNYQSVGDALKRTSTPTDAAVLVSNKYESPSIPMLGNRISYANSLYAGELTVPPTPGLSSIELANLAGRTQADGGDTSNNSEPTSGGVLSGTPWLGKSDKLSGQPYNVNPDAVDVSRPLTNVLHQYPSYTYGLSLHLLNASEYNTIVTDGSYIPNRVLVASAGRYNNVPGAGQFIRSPYFSDDFYFDDFTMTTVIGTNAHSRNTNAIELAFTLLEPYGMTLINRLLDQANDPEMNCDNYLDMVYLIQIDFFATDETGTIVGVVPGITKRIPIRLIQMDISTNTSGSKYDIKAVPYNHIAYDLSTVSTPANFEIKASTVGEFFQSGGTTNTSFNRAVNGWNKDLVNNNKIGVPDTYSFSIDPKIAGASFAGTGAISPRDTGMSDITNSNSIRQSNLGSASQEFNSSARTFSINAGTSIDKVIDNVIRHSDYIQNQIAIPDGVDPQTYLQQKAKNENQPLNWYRTVPTVTLGEFDPVRKVYAKNIIYHIQPYVIYNVKSDVAPQGKIDTFVKEYNYIYTGENLDVLTFDLNFNTLYYTAQTAYRSAMTSIFKTPDKSTSTKSTDNQNTNAYQGATQRPNSVMPMMVKPQVYNAKARATGGVITSKNVAVADLEDSLMTLSAADMLSVQLKIIGDPQFIKQDDCFYNPNTVNLSPGLDPRLTPNGSLQTDYGEIYVSLLFRTPVDVDEATGLYKFNVNYRTSVFSGLYKVLTVASEFKSGVFTQTLNLIRLPYQANYDYVNQPAQSTDQRTTDLSSTTINQRSRADNAQNVATQSAQSAEDSGLSAQAQAQDAVTPVPSKTQQDLSKVNETAPTQAVNQTNQPPQLGNNATDAALAQNYREKRDYLTGKAQEAEANGDTANANQYYNDAAQYDKWASTRQQRANGILGA